MQLVHWGGFQGVTSIEFSPTTTLISGASGTGKSTILDAYLALMMDSNTAFNGASNDAAVGRARGATQRNLVTYLRGKVDDTRENGEATEHVLRGAGSWTWGAIALTFVDDAQQRYTALRLYYVPRAATRDSEITKKMCTIAAVVDLKEFEPLADDKFEKRAIKSRFPSMDVHDTYESFAIKLYARLGIGAGGNGNSALRLLSRIQAGRPVTTVDDLYKSMVLEQPPTFEAADRAVSHFADLEAAYEEMVTAADKQAALREITDLWDDNRAHLDRVVAIEALGLDRGADSPFAHWAAGFESTLVTSVVDINRTERDKEFERQKKAADDEQTFTTQLNSLDAAIDDAGGGTLKSLDTQIETLTESCDDAVAARRTFDDQTAVLRLKIATSDEFADAQRRSRVFVGSGYEAQRRALQTEREAVQERGWPLRHEQRTLDAELESLQGREGRVPKDWHDARVDAARGAGLRPEDLPFVAELIDILPEHTEWRLAAELSLNSVARVMLVDEKNLDRLSRAIDPLQWRVRLNFEGVALRPFETRPLDPSMLSGKLAYKDTPFTAWIQERLTNPSTDALCVSSAADLAGGGRRVTKSGQTRHGRRGAHGRTNTPPIIGFDSKTRLAEIRERLTEIEQELKRADDVLNGIADREGELTALRDAHKFIVDTTWAVIDQETIARRIAELTDQRARILGSNDRLRELQGQRETVDGLRSEASRDNILAEAAVGQLDERLQALQQRTAELSAEVARLAAHGQASDHDQEVTLAARFADVADASTYQQATFGEQLARLANALRSDRTAAQLAAEKAANSLKRVFESYQGRWPDPNLGVSVESYPDYLAILEEITATGLHERSQEWVRRLTGWTGEDLVPLNGAFEAAIDDIQDRLAPVNAILASLPFGAHHDRLRIDLRRIHRDDHTQFRSQLRELSSGVTSEISVEQAEAKFKQLRTFIDRIRPARSGERNQRDYYLDVRKHVELSATVVATDGTIRAEYRSLGEKSGGETQELVAFIVGAALRFQLGDETRSRPRFAPVFLDEGFVKADSEFAGRGVNAWKGLGFQLVIAAPFDKVTALEPHIDQVLGVTKNPTTGHARVTDITDTSAQ